MISNEERNIIKNMYQMLFEMATGNISFRIEEIENNELGNIAKTLNSLAGKMKDIILKSGYVNPHYTYQNLIQVTLILNADFKIVSFSPNMPMFLHYSEDVLLKMKITDILSERSFPILNLIKKEMKHDEKYQKTIQLIFVDNQKQLAPFFCTVYRLVNTDNLFISTVTTVLQDITVGNSNTTPRKSDAIIIQEVYEYIMKHLEEPLPTLKQLSKLFGTNEFKLKDGFRHFFKTSIYKFYNEERLKQAHSIIQQTTIPLKEIAYMCGFNDYTNFSKAFKKAYNYPPSELKRRT
ncbi:helix-turn-helix domain-containing protein [Flavobacterium ardleyense]|uniref:Helix-turn-helix domain-containing protein n=1 Tax=Flavobacterium ardleyense TaxID=2038737 RepID=A0ABW5Z675_9FLAO